MKSRVQISEFFKQLESKFINFGRQPFATDILARNSIAFHDLTMWLFNNKIWFNNFKNVIKHLSSCLPVIDRTSEFLLAGPSVSGILRSSKDFFKPEDKDFIATGDFKHHMPLPSGTIFTLFNSTYIHTAFSIDDSSKIGYLFNGLVNMKNNFFSHVNPFVYNTVVLNEEKVHAERLNERASCC